MTEKKWHKSWKKLVKDEYTEYRVEFNGKVKRADIRKPTGKVIEIQGSQISPEEIKERENHYKNMIWIFDVRDKNDSFVFYERDGYYSFYWKWGWEIPDYCAMPVYLDFSGSMIKSYKDDRWSEIPNFLGRDKILKLGNLYPNTKTGGWGYVMTKNEFIQKYLYDILKEDKKYMVGTEEEKTEIETVKKDHDEICLGDYV